MKKILCCTFLVLASSVFAAKGPGAEWYQVAAETQWAAHSHAAMAAFQDSLWLAGGRDSESAALGGLWQCRDGLHWEKVLAQGETPWDARWGHTLTAFKGELWLIGGRDQDGALGDVWHSSDGDTWEEAELEEAFTPRYGHAAAVHDNMLWVLGGRNGDGRFNDVWRSGDGISWERATDSANWSPRAYAAAVRFQDRLWLLGGNDGSPRADVWASRDGLHWEAVLQRAPWEAREGFAPAVLDKELVLAGGKGADQRFSDVWHSHDGVLWRQSTGSPVWPPLACMASAKWRGSFWLAGGVGENGTLKNAVYVAGAALEDADGTPDAFEDHNDNDVPDGFEDAVASEEDVSPEIRRMERAAWREINRIRKEHGLKPLEMDPRLRRVAREHSRDMIAREFFGHVGPEDQGPGDRLEDAGITDYYAYAENVAMEGGHEDTVSFIVEGWMDSPTHRKNILNSGGDVQYTHTGIGVAKQGNAYYFTQLFARFKPPGE